MVVVIVNVILVRLTVSENSFITRSVNINFVMTISLSNIDVTEDKTIRSCFISKTWINLELMF